MTESQWLTLNDAATLLAFVVSRAASARKCRLFAVAASRRSTFRYPNPKEDAESEAIAKLAERFVDGLVTAKKFEAARRSRNGQGQWIVADPEASTGAMDFARADEDYECPQAVKAGLLRDLFGNPFRPAEFDPSWRLPTVTSLAEAAYEERLANFDLDPVRLSVLADALEDAGCRDEAILAHLRSEGPHVRGCWALDLVLGKQ